MEKIITEIRNKLEEISDPKTKETSQNFFKEKIYSYGVKTPLVSKLAKEFFKEIKPGSTDFVFSICEELWKSGYLEESIIACEWSYFIHKDYREEDFRIFEKWITDYVNNWASCDTLCNHSLGEFVEMYPRFLSDLRRFAKSHNRWMRRASAVSLIIPARKGKFLKEIFEIADILLTDEDDLVRKGYGWMLKAASQAHQQEVFEYVMKNKTLMPRTALRYAIEKMPADLKTRAMEK